MVKKLNIPTDNNIIKVTLEEVMPDNYLPYAVEVAKERALPDVRDGLKPVHRRILYGAYMLKAMPDKPYYKSARIVGDILGKYHPHGDSSVYEAMVILAQNFATRLPLIDGHGNWGSQDGDSAAAMRYTEARLSAASLELLRDIEKGVVDMVENYSGSELEPSVLPARYPNLLVNGSFGIAVGLSTNIPPHNLREVIAATLAYIDNNGITTEELMKYIKGPDLPTGGIIIGKNSLLAAYETGEGKATLRAKTKIEKLENGRIGIVITEFPYKRSKAKLLQTISEMTGDKKHSKILDAITDIRDESDRDGIRAVIELKKLADMETAERVLKYLFKKTELQCNVIFNIVAICNGKPETLNLKRILSCYIDHQREVVTRRSKRELEIAEKRFHIVEGFIKAIDIMDEIIKVIRASKSKKDAAANLMESFGFTQIQAEAVLELMLYRLTGLEIKAFLKEKNELGIEIKRLRSILENENVLLKLIKSELKEISDKFGDDRRTEIIENDDIAKIEIEEIMVSEEIVVTLSKEGYIKCVPQKSYNRGNTENLEIEYREGDALKWLLNSNSMDTIAIFTDKGNMYQIKGSLVPEFKLKEKGVKLDEIIKSLDLNLERIVGALSLDSFISDKKFLFVTSKGFMKKVGVNSFVTNYTKLQAIKLKEEERVINATLVDNDRVEKYINVKTKLGMDLTVEEPILQEMERMGLGVPIVNIAPKDEIVEIEFTEVYIYKTFLVGIDNSGKIKIHNRDDRKITAEKKCYTNSSSKLLFFLDNGNTIILAAALFENFIGNEINISEFTDEFDPRTMKVLNITSTLNFSEDLDIYYITKLGMIKKTEIKEFEGENSSILGYKFKSLKDQLINVEIVDSTEDPDIIIITKRAMCIRFKGNDMNKMGRIASGVTGISLRSEDTVAGAIIFKNQGGQKTLSLKSNKKLIKKLSVEDVKLQNRAGMGSNIMLIVLDDFLEEIKLV